MKIKTLAALALAALLGSALPAFAGAELCAPTATSAAAGPRTIGGTGSKVPSSAIYSLNSAGCAWVTQQDLAFFLSQGFTYGANLFSVSVTGIAAQTTTSNSPILPAYAKIQGIVVQETAGQAVTGGLDIGIAGSSDQTIVAAFAVPASSILNIPTASILRQVFGAAGATTGTPSAQQIFFNAHTNWTDAATINVTILYSLYGPF